MNFIKNILGFLSSKDKDPIFVQLNNLLGFEPQKIHLYHLAFSHKSMGKNNNERLEFLGDSILDAVISEIIYKHFPNKNEGELSKLRSKMVSRNMLNKLGTNLGLLDFLEYKATKATIDQANFEGNALEALIGAIYLDQGYEKSKLFVLNQLINPFIDWKKIENEVIDHKSLLYSYAQKENKTIKFEVLNEDVKDFNNRFHVAAKIDDKILAEAKGKSKKSAEQKAAKISLEIIDSLNK